MAVLRTFYKCLIVIGTSNETTAIIKDALSQDYKLFFAQDMKSAQKYFLKYDKNILEFIVDAQANPELAIEFLREWETDLVYQSIPVVALVDFNKREIERNILDHQVTNIIYSPFQADKILKHVEATVRRNALIENRMLEIYDEKIKTINEKTTLIPACINCGVAFFRMEEDQAYIDYANKLFVKMLGSDTVRGILSNLSNEEGAKLLAAATKAKMSFEPVIVPLTIVLNDETHVYDLSIAQINNLDAQAYEEYVYKFIVSVVDRTERETYKVNYEEKQHLYESIVSNINGGVMVVEIDGDTPKLIDASESLLRYTGFEANDSEFLTKIFPAYTIKMVMEERRSREQNIYGGIEESFSFITKINTADGTEKHAKVVIVLYRYDDNKIRTNTLILDDTKEYESNQKLKELYEFDQTTKLFTNSRFVETTEKLLRSDEEKEYKLIVIRIHKFDELQSFFGKPKADELLRVISDGMKKFASRAIKGRIDTKSFALSYDSTMIDEKKFIKELDDYVKENYTAYQVKLYYGVYTVSDVYDAIDSMIIQTTFAVKEIEGNALKNFIYCDSRLKSRILESDNITNEMKKALDNNEFEVFLQPVFDLKTRKILSAEALTRWHHPKRGYIPPTEYIPIFEENGFIVNVDHYVWETSCKIIREWLDAGVAVPISVNVSRIDLFSIDFYTVITELVEKYDIPVEYLRLEITESAFVLNENSVIEIVDKLRRYGFKILMDDFGSGYSSLNSLRFINVDFLKIDMDLVRGIEESIKQANILKSVINLGTTLNLDLICEGVETEKQAEFVNGCGCEKAQGWLFSKAIPLSEFNEKMKNN